MNTDTIPWMYVPRESLGLGDGSPIRREALAVFGRRCFISHNSYKLLLKREKML